MTRSGKGTLNLPLISITDGKMVGEVKDLYLDMEASCVSAVQVAHTGFISPKSHIVERDAIQLFGQDAFLVKGPNVVTEISEEKSMKEYNRMEDLLGREVTTEGGTKIGTIGDLILDQEARILGFALDKVHVKGPVAEKRTFPRSAVIEMGVRAHGLGAKDNPMIVDLAKAEGGG